MQVELVSGGIDRFDLESEAQAHASEVDGLASGSRPFRLEPLNPDTATPLGIAFPCTRFAQTSSPGAATTAAGRTDRPIVYSSSFLFRGSVSIMSKN